MLGANPSKRRPKQAEGHKLGQKGHNMPKETWLHFPGFPPIKGIGEPIVAIEAIGPDDDEMPLEEAKAAARKIGEQNGKNAASWVFDGNTSIETYQTVLHGLNEGDPLIYNMYREPNLSGEYADDYSIQDLFNEIGIEYDSTITDDQEEIGDAYVEAARDAFWHEVERVARLQLG
jgi:hypothetical protein